MKRSHNTVFFAAGGTGGHIYPAVALAQALLEQDPDWRIHFVGGRGMEKRIIPPLGFPLHHIAVRGVVRRLTLSNLLVPFILIAGLLGSAVLLIKYRPGVVVGTGGYVSGPVVWTAAKLGIPTLIQEQNSKPGATTRLLARVVDEVHLSFPESRQAIKSAKHVVVTGNPVRSFPQIDQGAAREYFGLKKDIPTLLIFGGSQGAHAINKIVLDALNKLMKTAQLQIIWSTGMHDRDEISEKIQPYKSRIWIGMYIEDMGQAYRACDLALTRAGALTLAELTLCRVPSILVPYPYAAANHQEINAETLQAKGAAIVIRQDDLKASFLIRTLEQLFGDNERRSRMAEAAGRAAYPQATSDLVRAIIEKRERK